jgi:arsenate reductase-like glutaredoxin family protein
LREQNVEAEERDLGRQPLSEAELDALIGNRPHMDFMNPRNDLYRARNMKEKPPSRAEAIKLMAKEPNLIRRPIFRRGDKWVFGFDPVTVEAILK